MEEVSVMVGREGWVGPRGWVGHQRKADEDGPSGSEDSVPLTYALEKCEG